MCERRAVRPHRVLPAGVAVYRRINAAVQAQRHAECYERRWLIFPVQDNVTVSKKKVKVAPVRARRQQTGPCRSPRGIPRTVLVRRYIVGTEESPRYWKVGTQRVALFLRSPAVQGNAAALRAPRRAARCAFQIKWRCRVLAPIDTAYSSAYRAECGTASWCSATQRIRGRYCARMSRPTAL